MKKALHISPNVYESISSAGGTKKIWEELAKNYDEYHVLGRANDGKFHEMRDGKIVLHTVPNVLNKFFPFFITSFWGLRKISKQNNFDIVICQCPILGGYAAVKRMKNVPILIEMHGFFYFNILEGKGIKNKILGSIIRYSYNNCTVVRSLNEKMTQRLQTDGITNRVCVVENRVDMSLFSKKKENQKITGTIKLISIGNFEEVKGHKYALYAMKILQEKYDIKLILVSGGSLKDAYERFAKENDINLELIDRCTQEELVNIMEETNIYIHTSIREGMPRVILEAMAMKIPVVSSKAGFIEGTIKHRENGLLTEIGDVDGLVTEIEYLINSEDERTRLVENAYKDIEERFEWNKCFDRYRALLLEVENS